MTGRNYTFVELRDVALDEAARIVGTQQALVASGDRKAPSAEEIARANKFGKLAELVDRMRGNQAIIAQLRKASPP